MRMWKGTGVSAEVVIRPMHGDDIEAAEAAAWSALRVQIPEELMSVAQEDHARGRARRRMDYLLGTDPGGAWVAAAGPEIAGVALALVRESVWGLSLLAVAPGHQGRGIGTRLMATALGYGEKVRGGLIVSSLDPRAMRRYALAGFALHPTMSATGIADRGAVPAGLRSRPGDPRADREICDAASRAARGAAHGEDVAHMVEGGPALLVHDGGGFALHHDGRIVLLAATDDVVARDLMWSCLAAMPPGTTASVESITAAQGWAIEVALAARLALSPDGPLFTRGELGPLAPYLPSGGFL